MIGKILNDFTILKLLGSGGMGEVYLAMQNSLEREVAIKIIKINPGIPDKNHIVDRFLREARITASIQHPNIVNVYSAGKEEDFLYIAMEYVRGSSLESQIAANGIPEIVAWNIALQLCQALQTALQNGIIHRDIKPANILLTTQRVPKLVDFGLSKKMDDEHITVAGMILGTPNYMSPEQASGEIVDFRSDIYSLGATIYHALTGHILFSGKSALDIVYKHKFEYVKAPQEYNPHLKRETSAILGKMLQKNTNDRYQSYGDLIVDIRSLLENQSVSTAENTNAFSIYTESSQLQARYATTKRKSLINALRSLSFLKKNKSSRILPLILVSGVTPTSLQTQIEKESDGELHAIIMTSLPELIVSLSQQIIPIILDSNYLGVRVFDFCAALKREYPAAPLAILVDSASIQTNLTYADGILCLPYAGNEQNMASLLAQNLHTLQFPARRISLKTLLSLARVAKWTTSLLVNRGSMEEATLVIQEGEIVQARQKQLRGELALRSIFQGDSTWQIDPDVLTRHCESDQVSRNISKMASSNSQPTRFDPKFAQEHVHSTKTASDVTIRDAHYETTPTPTNETKLWKILVVDKNSHRGEHLTGELNNLGSVMALTVISSQDALDLMNIENFHLVVSTSEMSTTTGDFFYREIRKQYPHVYQIVLGEISSNGQNVTPDDSYLVFLGKESQSTLIAVLRQWQSITP